ncbi:MAG: hypothetical protein KDA90_00015, partial [Planctomycetaceae bacterium]|nr:hypothetical protein [Planctomycetaceae bacterium]
MYQDDDLNDDRRDEFEDDVYRDELDDDRPRRRRAPKSAGMSTGFKVVIALLVIFALGMCTCCGVGVYFARQAMNFTDDPAEIGAIQQKIADIELPEDMAPAMGGSMNLGLFQMDLAGYGQQNGKFLMLMQMQISGAEEAEVERQFRQQANQQGDKDIVIKKSEVRTLTVDGEEREFVFAEGTMDVEGTQVAVHQVTGM